MKKIRGAAVVAAVMGALALSSCSGGNAEYKSIDEITQKLSGVGYSCQPADIDGGYAHAECDEGSFSRDVRFYADEALKARDIEDLKAEGGLNQGGFSRADRWIVEGKNWTVTVFTRDDPDTYPMEETANDLAKELGGSVWPRSK